ncbi:DNA-binding protein [Pantoea agglomerans]|uniref:DNA-binding protein n=1 Tax=Enterobacter agglomerans TaxID=549 RepID=UPI00241351D2|nr:DNA-binding protein [Pantoea agglomerans]
MSRLLINENPLQVLPTLACAVGLNEAVILQQMHYWMSSSQHFYNGRRWVYNSVPNWQKQFPFWSESTVKRALLSLERQGMVVSGNFNRDPRDHSKWYSINYEALASVESAQKSLNDASGQFDPIEQVNMTRCNGSACTDAQGQSAPMQQANMTRPLPENTTEITQEITTEIKNTSGTPAKAAEPPRNAKQEYSPEFETAWKAYPKRAGGNPKPSAWKHWKARLKEGVGPDDMLAGVQRYAAYCRATGNTGTQFVKQAATFFGPDRHFDETWQAPSAPGGGRGNMLPVSGFSEQDYGKSDIDW